MIYLKNHFLEISSYVKTFAPDSEGEVDIKTLCKIWSCDQGKALEIAKNHPDFTYADEPSNNGNKTSQKDGGKSDK